ncbi:MAG: isocitrate lyase/PEP mutase family protein [Magnetococcales bacterium]|nr:isocitrate lyase/PEP mutase family protein [Magnetococcales bacterium]
MNGCECLRALLERPGFLFGPGVYDCLSAKVAEQSGCELIFSSGFGIAAATLGLPDIGLITGTEMLQAAGHIAAAVRIPLIADMDTGYGNPLNVIRTVTSARQLGVAGVILEDQEWPKRCGHMSGKRIISLEEHVEKIRAAVHAREEGGAGGGAREGDIVIVARTDARAIEGLDAAIRRGQRYREAGADMIFVEAPESAEELRTIAKELAGVPLMVNLVEGGRTPNLPFQELAAMGFKLGVSPLSALFEATAAMQKCFLTMREEGTVGTRAVDFDAFKEIVATERFYALERRFTSP